MWEILEIESTATNQKFKVLEDSTPISNQRFLQLLIEEQAFRSFYNKYLSDLEYNAFFWENSPMTNSKMTMEYECNVINSDYLAGVTPDSQTFRPHFKSDKQVVTFQNLGGDAQLIAPCPRQSNAIYTPSFGRRQKNRSWLSGNR